MCVMFKKLLGAEKVAQMERAEARREQSREMLAGLTDEEFADRLEYTIINSELPNKYMHRDMSTYDEALVQVYLLEVLRRFRGEDKASKHYQLYNQLSPRIDAQGKLG